MDQIADDYGDIRLAFNAAAALDALAAHLYWWAVDNAPDRVAGLRSDDAFRHKLAAANRDFRLTFEVAKANKHVRLVRGRPTVRSASQLTAEDIGWDEAAVFDEARWDVPMQVVIAAPDVGGYEIADAVFGRALAFLEKQMIALGV